MGGKSIRRGEAKAARRAAAGGCLCGAITFRAECLRDVVNCHCRECRKFHGHYAAYTETGISRISVRGEENLAWYRLPGRDARRGFCKICGSSLFWQKPADSGSLCVAAGALDSPSSLHTVKNVYVKDAGDYYVVDDSLPMYAGTMKNALPVNSDATGKRCEN